MVGATGIDSFRPFGAPPSNSPQKNTSSFFGDPEEGGKEKDGRDQQPLRLSFGKPSSRAVEPALGQEISPQWEISKFASGQSHTVALPRKHLLTLTQGRLKEGDSFRLLRRQLPLI